MIDTIVCDISLVSRIYALKEVCYFTTSIAAIHFFYDNVIISWEHLKRSTSQRHCVYFTTLFATKKIVVDSRKFEEYVYLMGAIDCSSALLKVPIYSTEPVSVIFL